MSRYRRGPIGRPFGSGSQSRLFSSVLMLIVVAMVYTQAKDARNWRWLEAREAEAQEVAPSKKPREWKEVVIEAPHDGDPEELATCRMQLGAATDKQPLDGLEMAGYYRLLKWARAQPFEDLEVRAKRNVPYTQIFESPQKYRGQLVRLRLHVQRIVVHEDVAQNSAEARQLYELWGFTDESKSHPYSVVVPEIPSWFKTGGEVEEECVFVGYFFKLLAYEAFQTHRAAPLLMGRIRPISGPSKQATAESSVLEFAIGGVVLALVGAASWYAVATRRASAKRRMVKRQADPVTDWLTANPPETNTAPVAMAEPAVAPAMGELANGP